MESRYSIITLPDGTVRRVSNKIIQKAGAPRTTEEIDHDLSPAGPRMKLVLTEKGWGPSDESWYDMLNITPDYLVQKCAEQGLTDQETQQVIRNWNTRLFNTSHPKPTEKEAEALRGDRKFDPNLSDDIRSAHETYLNTTVKEAERKAYQGCKLSYRKSSLPRVNKEFCESFMCNPVPYTKAISNDETLHEAVHMDAMPESKKQTINSCYRSGYVCSSAANDYPSMYDPKRFHYVPNSGSGDCLFIAFSNYMTLVKGMGGVYPNPMSDNTGLPAFSRPTENIAAADRYRQSAVSWLRDNLNTILPNQDYSVKQELAILALEDDPQVNVVNPSVKRQILADFIRDHPNEAEILGSLSLNRLLDMLRNVDGFLQSRTGASEEVSEAALDMLMQVYAQAYLDAMENRSTYGGQPEIMALAMVNQVNIIVLQMNENMLQHNSGYVYVNNPRGTVYIFHNQSVTGVGGLHYEIMFPRTGASEAPESQKSAPKAPIGKFTKADIDTFVKIGFRVAAPTASTVNKFLAGLKGDKLVDSLNVLFQNKMQAMDATSPLAKDILYTFIDNSLGKLSKADRDTFLLSMPALKLRAAAEDLENWEDPAVQDQRLADIFAKHVTLLCGKNQPSILNVQDDTISGRLRYALAGFLNEEENPVEPDDLLTWTITDMYDIANKLIESPNAQIVQDFFFTEFMENFFYVTVPIVAIIGQGPPPVPGVNHGTDLQAIVDIINIFNEYVDLDDN